LRQGGRPAGRVLPGETGGQHLLDADELAQGLGQKLAFTPAQAGDLQVHQQMLARAGAVPAAGQQAAPRQRLDHPRHHADLGAGAQGQAEYGSFGIFGLLSGSGRIR
jgi:hypothetical protein